MALPVGRGGLSIAAIHISLLRACAAALLDCTSISDLVLSSDYHVLRLRMCV